MVQKGIKGHGLVSEVLHEWESIVNRVAKKEVGEKMIVAEQLDGGIMSLRIRLV